MDMTTAGEHRSVGAKAWQAVDPIWMRRSQIAADWLGKVPAVVDIGCGAMALRSLLPEGVKYIGCDVVAREPETIVCDLNRERLPQFGVTDASMLGVFEYLSDVPDVLKQLRQFERIVTSYCHHSFWRSLKKRRQYWINHYTQKQFTKFITEAGFKIVRSQRMRVAETIYYIERI